MEFQKAFLVDRNPPEGQPKGPTEIFGVVYVAPDNFGHAAQIGPQLCYHTIADADANTDINRERFVPVAEVTENTRQYRILCENDVLGGRHR